MAKEEHLAILKQGVDAWNRWRIENLETPDLSGANLNRANLNGADLNGANLIAANLFSAHLVGSKLITADLSGANLDVANLNGARLMQANLAGASLQKARLDNANLFDANLSNARLINAYLGLANLTAADLTDANLCGTHLAIANLSGAKLSGVNLRGATLFHTRFTECDLRKVEGLDSVNHGGPSSIGIDTIYQSRGIIPEVFLRGCGVQEGLITQMHSLVGAEDGIQFYSCFISYSGIDEDFAKRLHGKMRDAHLRVWFAPEDIQGGKKLDEQIETAIRVYDKLLIVLSEASLRSEWVMDELRKGFKAERDTGKRKLFPVRLASYETLQGWECRDSVSGKDLAEEVRQYFIPDFSNWKDHDSFEAAFDRLLKDLRADSNRV
ncbi:MAG: toll/interleukin-1 receptor domain-containing protein [Chthoniobacterales bacterium]